MLIVAFLSPDAADVSPAPTAAAVAKATTASANTFRILSSPSNSAVDTYASLGYKRRRSTIRFVRSRVKVA